MTSRIERPRIEYDIYDAVMRRAEEPVSPERALEQRRAARRNLSTERRRDLLHSLWNPEAAQNSPEARFF